MHHAVLCYALLTCVCCARAAGWGAAPSGGRLAGFPGCWAKGLQKQRVCTPACCACCACCGRAWWRSARTTSGWWSCRPRWTPQPSAATSTAPRRPTCRHGGAGGAGGASKAAGRGQSATQQWRASPAPEEGFPSTGGGGGGPFCRICRQPRPASALVPACRPAARALSRPAACRPCCCSAGPPVPGVCVLHRGARGELCGRRHHCGPAGAHPTLCLASLCTRAHLSCNSQNKRLLLPSCSFLLPGLAQRAMWGLAWGMHWAQRL